MTRIERSDEDILNQLKNDSEAAVETLFRKYYTYVCHVIYRILPQPSHTEDIAQDVFYEVWRKRETLRINTSLKAYLRRAAVNRTLNFIRDKKMDFNVEEPQEYHVEKLPLPQKNLEAAELEQKITSIIDELPERCRIVFMLSRFEDFSYKEIASELDISVKTVEHQISKALRYLRDRLGHYS